MLNVFRRRVAPLLLQLAALSSLTAATFAGAQAQTISTLARQLNRIDVGLSGIGQFRSNATGTNYQDTSITQSATSGFGGLVQVRYTKSLLVGAEFNYTIVRYSENYNSNSTTAQPNPIQYIPGGVQTSASEYTFGYVAHAPSFFGLRPFGSVGVGSTEFSPTTYGGQGLPARARLTYYYGIGVDASVLPHIGIRAQYRQPFFKAPDFGQNYLTINQRTSAVEPAIGIYLHF